MNPIARQALAKALQHPAPAHKLAPVPKPAPVDEDGEFEKAYQSVIDNGWTNVKHMARQVWQARAKLNGATKVMLPERMPGITHTDSHEEGWNACLDEVAKLNGIET